MSGGRRNAGRLEIRQRRSSEPVRCSMEVGAAILTQEAKRRRKKKVALPGCEKVSQSAARHIQEPTGLACWPPSDAVS